jgi:hypothetical protein
MPQLKTNLPESLATCLPWSSAAKSVQSIAQLSGSAPVGGAGLSLWAARLAGEDRRSGLKTILMPPQIHLP